MMEKLYVESLICDTLDFWVSINLFSEKRSKVWWKMSSFGERTYDTTIDNVLQKRYILVLQFKLIYNQTTNYRFIIS